MINGLAVTNSRAVQRVALWRLTTIRPEKRACRAVPFEVDRFRQTLEQNFDVGPVRRINAGSDTERGAEDSSFVSLRFAFLSPVEKTALGIHGDADAMPAPVIAILLSQAGLNVHLRLAPASNGPASNWRRPHLGERTITDFERGASNMLAPNKSRLCKAFEAAGVTFDGSHGVGFAEPGSVNTPPSR